MKKFTFATTATADETFTQVSINFSAFGDSCPDELRSFSTIDTEGNEIACNVPVVPSLLKSLPLNILKALVYDEEFKSYPEHLEIWKLWNVLDSFEHHPESWFRLRDQDPGMINSGWTEFMNSSGDVIRRHGNGEISVATETFWAGFNAQKTRRKVEDSLRKRKDRPGLVNLCRFAAWTGDITAGV